VTEGPRGIQNIAVGTIVVASDGAILGRVHEVHRHVLLVRPDEPGGQHKELEVPIQAITEIVGDHLRVSVTRRALSTVDDDQTAHQLLEDGE
jgi:hypothetical protein